jgi:hypothetical protein
MNLRYCIFAVAGASLSVAAGSTQAVVVVTRVAAR